MNGEMTIRPACAADQPALIRLVAGFRAALAELRGEVRPPDLTAAAGELAEYAAKDFPVFVAEDETPALTGYLVCRVDGDVVWAESLYVTPECRRQGVGERLYAEAERLALELGGDKPYNWVDPNNDKIIRFLQKRGYNVLNLIELRHAHPGEALNSTIRVGKFEFKSRP
ncbi:MAG TPA: GNAT family N-acetyltransferase [Anaerolineaceae bacterium]|nr:GNAT family N-acetyltransferase [Anaerolineaceae bacterium]HPN51821.1 GNAT family N-acetyltransferase [Anaerolineaceae bacterium]